MYIRQFDLVKLQLLHGSVSAFARCEKC